MLPALVLLLIALPSLRLLFYLEAPTRLSARETVKAVGHQWYWGYDIVSTKGTLSLDRYMTNEVDLVTGSFRLLEVDTPILLTLQSYVRFVATAADVLHSFAVPALGVKVDAIPGRLNQQFSFLKNIGVFFGQCSEICGANHSFMPISIEVTPNPGTL